MAIINQGILGGVSKRIGNVVGASWKGIPVIRIYQPNVANPNTTAQRKQRSDFKLLAHYGSELLATLIKPFWDRFSIRQSGFNAFIQAQKLVPGPGLETDLEKLTFAKGKMAAPVLTKLEISDETATVDGNFTEYGRYGAEDDTLCMVFFDQATKFVKAVVVPDCRYTNRLDIADVFELEDLKGKTLKARVIFARKDGSIVSEQSNMVEVLDTGE